ncbi:MAG: PilZ domain-containing protein [Blastocatellia bacterium]
MTKRKQAAIGESNWHSGQADRRVSQRFQIGWDISIQRTDHNGEVHNETGILDNLSSSGSHLNLAGLGKVGDKLEVCIKLPTNKKRWMRYSCEIVRLQSNDSGVGIGIKFDKMRPEFF